MTLSRRPVPDFLRNHRTSRAGQVSLYQNTSFPPAQGVNESTRSRIHEIRGHTQHDLCSPRAGDETSPSRDSTDDQRKLVIRFVGDQRSGATPVPIPNTAVKPGPPMILHRGKVGHRRRFRPRKVNLARAFSFLGLGPWALGLGCWALGVGPWALGLGCWALGLGPWAFCVLVLGG